MLTIQIKDPWKPGALALNFSCLLPSSIVLHLATDFNYCPTTKRKSCCLAPDINTPLIKKAWMNNANCFIMQIGEAVSINDMVELKRMIPSDKPVGVIYEVKREWNNIILNLISRSWPLSTILKRKNGVQCRINHVKL